KPLQSGLCTQRRQASKLAHASSWRTRALPELRALSLVDPPPRPPLSERRPARPVGEGRWAVAVPPGDHWSAEAAAAMWAQQRLVGRRLAIVLAPPCSVAAWLPTPGAISFRPKG